MTESLQFPSIPTAPADYPAAHSMDTTWWAVDRNGLVAKFDTGEAGAAPLAATAEEGGVDLTAALATAPGVTFSCDALFSQADGKLYLRGWGGDWTKVGEAPVEASVDERYCHGYLLWLRDEAALAQLQQATPNTLLQRAARLLTGAPASAPAPPQIVRLPVADKVVVWIESGTAELPPQAVIRGWLATGLARRGWLYQRSLEEGRFGVISYQMDRFDNWISGPFERSGLPAAPLAAGALPAELRAQVEANQFLEADFRSDLLIQPFEHGEAYCWDEHWISTTGEARRREDYGPDVETVAAQVGDLAPGGSQLASLAAAYLLLEPGASDVFSDYLQQAGLPPVENRPTGPARLDELLLRFLSPRQRQSLECESVAQLLLGSALPPETHAVVQAVLNQVRAKLAASEGAKPSPEYEQAAQAAFQAWMPDDYEGEAEEFQVALPARVAWAAWALANDFPLVAARTARAVDPEQLTWQAQRLLRELAAL